MYNALVSLLIIRELHRVTTYVKILPSLKIGSALYTLITKFKTDPTDYTMGISILATSLMNADFYIY